MFNPDTLATWIQRMMVTKQNEKLTKNITRLVQEEAGEKQLKSGEIQVHNTQQYNSLWSSRERQCLFLLQQKGTSRTLLLQMHALMIKVSLQANVNLLTKFITTVASMVGIKYARQLFDERSHRDDAFFCNMMMKAYVGHGHFDDTLILYRGLRRGTVFVPDSFTFLNLAKACSSELWFWEGMEIHNHVVKSGFGSYLFVSTSLIDMYAKCMNMSCARKLFDEMVEKSEVSWTALIGGYARSGDVDSVKDLFNQMPEKDTAAYNMMIDVFVKLGDVDSARSLFDQMPERSVVSWTSMIDGYCNVGDVVSAKLLFDEIPEKNLYSWNAMIGGYCRNKESHEALQLFRELQAETLLEPDNVTIVSVLPAVADLGALDLGCWIHNYVRKKELDKYANVCTALVDMYAKCGEITKARTAFDKMSNKEVVSWNALINGLAVNGRAEEALEAFSEMKQKGFKPNDVTMIGVLSACSHGGLVEEGMRWFREMQELKVTPKIEHYGCMIDLFGRSRCLEEAEKLIKAMPYEINEIILSTFLSACNDRKDVARAERILKKMAAGKAWSDGNYIMLRNLYALERRWGDVREIKGVMRRKGTKKEVGCSSIEVDSRVCEFVSGDTVHPHWCLIHSISKKLHMNMRSKYIN
ncbi:pentatricopeptide repeat-containing protein At2g44880 [Daucus carota subsp. sativus]|nr:PREDICTED: pentatricopeptide repeat-containing protein At2g44880 [Daucus carota subsp. sativus]XP_017223793.1 PREDICTED: pentatricopeptide repeat-containing protein At2g44880 [Daucus carota subsp. sativus]XP_017223795.1 PREDICTED: pentatricopeptide repeat-containing protein At2g44880 [Daucus carota subsp. sativus]XP_017223796.1 PREDICTED: pentatricopeptide repeat-containing protein At2g44880 [Daucus carota subsp. sativus]